MELTREQARERTARFMPEPVIEGTLDILGRPAGSFAGWARHNVRAFR